MVLHSNLLKDLYYQKVRSDQHSSTTRFVIGHFDYSSQKKANLQNISLANWQQHSTHTNTHRQGKPKTVSIKSNHKEESNFLEEKLITILKRLRTFSKRMSILPAIITELLINRFITLLWAIFKTVPPLSTEQTYLQGLK